MRRPTFDKLLLLLTLGLLARVPQLEACNVPIFRYALEFWGSEHYELFVFHQTPLSDADQTLARSLVDAGAGPTPSLNLRAHIIALSQLPPEDRAASPASRETESLALDRAAQIWAHQTAATPPWAVLIAPHTGDSDPVWTGPFNAETVKRLISSPARAEIAKRLLSGQSAVWLLLESGRPELDDAAARKLTEALKTAESTLELPPPAPDDPLIHAALPLRIAFSTLRVSRTDPGEEILVRTLLNGEPALPETPVAFPIFGQGRALAAITAPDLTPRVIQEASAFICGPCSCEIKDLNPGKDLLLSANWASIYDAPIAASVAAPPPQRVEQPSPVKRRLLLSATALAFLAGLGAIVVVTRARRNLS